MKNNILKSPDGMRSYLPDLAFKFKEIEQRIFDVFKLWGYQPVITPTLEYFDSLTVGMGSRLKKELYKFIDYEGNILALRPEMTAPIARTLAGRLDDLTFPQRLSYSASVFRHGQPQSGKNREIYQVGIELIGEKNALADAEAIIIAIESLINAGVKRFKIDIGHAGFLDGIINQLNLNNREKNKLKAFLVQRDLVGLRNYINNLNPDTNRVLDQLPLLRGDKDVLNLAGELVDNRKSITAIENLKQIYSYLSDYGVEEYINFDLSLIRGLDYYTGVVFEGFTEKLGYTICGGGRYDNLIGQYSGVDLPAIGFAIGVERVRLALEKQGYCFPLCRVDAVIVFNAETSKLALKTARNLREKGLVIISLERKEVDRKLLSFSKSKGASKVISFCPPPEEDKLKIYDLTSNSRETISIKDWEERLWQR